MYYQIIETGELVYYLTGYIENAQIDATLVDHITVVRPMRAYATWYTKTEEEYRKTPSLISIYGIRRE